MMTYAWHRIPDRELVLLLMRGVEQRRSAGDGDQRGDVRDGERSDDALVDADKLDQEPQQTGQNEIGAEHHAITATLSTPADEQKCDR